MSPFAIALTVVVALLAAAWARFLWRWRQASRLERDRSVWARTFQAQGGIKRDAKAYDQAKAVAGSQRARRQTASGRPLPRPSRRRETRHRRDTSGGIALVPTSSRRRAGGGE